MYKNCAVCLNNDIHSVNFPCALTYLASRLLTLAPLIDILAFADEPALRLWALTCTLDRHSGSDTSSLKQADKAEKVPTCGREDSKNNNSNISEICVVRTLAVVSRAVGTGIRALSENWSTAAGNTPGRCELRAISTNLVVMCTNGGPCFRV